jgi:ABC-type transporter Mla subunit MlaD
MASNDQNIQDAIKENDRAIQEVRFESGKAIEVAKEAHESIKESNESIQKLSENVNRVESSVNTLSKDIASVIKAVGKGAEAQASSGKAVVDLTITMEKVLTENQHMATALVEAKDSAEKNQELIMELKMKEKTYDKAASDTEELVERRVLWDDAVLWQKKTAWAIIVTLIVSLVSSAVSMSNANRSSGKSQESKQTK